MIAFAIEAYGFTLVKMVSDSQCKEAKKIVDDATKEEQDKAAASIAALHNQDK